MARNFEFVARLVRLRAPLLTAIFLVFAGCGKDELLSPESSTLPEGETLSDPADGTVQVDDPAMASVSFAGGIPMGLFHLPSTSYGSRYNGGVRTPGTYALLTELAAVKARGGKVMLSLSGSQKYYKDAAGHFSLSKWKARVDRFRRANLSSYINDGTIIGHFLIDEPYDAHNFNGQKVGGGTLEAMAKYSKQIWPSMATIVRGEPYLIQWSGRYTYLDAAWAQYLYRKGNVNDYLSKNVSSAQKMGLGLVVGLNIPHGGVRNSRMSASQVQSWGSALLNSSYPCAFISWKYGDGALTTSGMQSAMDALRRKAQSRSSRSCRG